MKKQYLENPNVNQELEILKKQLEPEDMYIIGYLKGFDRKMMKEWREKGLWEY